MKRKQTPGERIARKLWADGDITRIAVELWLWKCIDAAIRRAQAAAWDEGWNSFDSWQGNNCRGDTSNPYRKARRK